MRSTLSFATFLCAALIAAATLKADVSSDFEESTEDPPMPASEPILGTAVEAAVGDEPPQLPKDPFTPYDVGDPASIISLDELTPAEQEVVQRGRNVDSWRGIHDSYGAAVALRSKQARARAAQHQLGIDNLATQGVVE
jgi:hypothetical protein